MSYLKWQFVVDFVTFGIIFKLLFNIVDDEKQLKRFHYSRFDIFQFFVTISCQIEECFVLV